MVKEMKHGSDEAHACVEVDTVLPLNRAIDSSYLYFPHVANFSVST